MFELRCSKVGLFCSESAGHKHLVREQGVGGSKSPMIPLVAGVDWNHRPLGYEKRSQPLSAVESIAQR
jgi:hypothetical protein